MSDAGLERSREPNDRESTTWASGRVLSSTQRQRKRVKDRVTSRRRRHETRAEIAQLRDHVAELTNQVELLQKNAECLSSIPVRATRVSAENQFDRNEASSSTIGYFQPHGRRLSDNLLQSSSSVQSFVSSMSQMTSIPQILPNSSFSSSLLEVDHEEYNSERSFGQTLGGFSIDLDGMDASIDMHPSYLPKWTLRNGIQRFVDEIDPGTAQDVFSSAVSRVQSLGKRSVCFDERRNQDALLRGVIHGWDEVHLRHRRFCPLWAILRYLDQRMFRLTGIITRVCTMFMIHRLLLCFVSGEAQYFDSLPGWYRPRKLQLQVPHVPAVDVLPWPALREHAIRDASLTLSDSFWTRVIYDFRFHWPFAVDEVFDFNIDNGLFGFSALFQKSIRNLNTWQMDLNFFTSFPDTYEDLVRAPAIPRCLHVDMNGHFDAQERRLPLPLPVQ